MKAHIVNLDETCLLLNGNIDNCSRRLTVTYYDIQLPQLGKATSKSALTMTMITGSTVAIKPLPPHFQFRTATQTAKTKAICIKMICYMLDLRGMFGHQAEQSLPSRLV